MSADWLCHRWKFYQIVCLIFFFFCRKNVEKNMEKYNMILFPGLADFYLKQRGVSSSNDVIISADRTWCLLVSVFLKHLSPLNGPEAKL